VPKSKRRRHVYWTSCGKQDHNEVFPDTFYHSIDKPAKVNSLTCKCFKPASKTPANPIIYLQHTPHHITKETFVEYNFYNRKVSKPFKSNIFLTGKKFKFAKCTEFKFVHYLNIFCRFYFFLNFVPQQAHLAWLDCFLNSI